MLKILKRFILKTTTRRKLYAAIYLLRINKILHLTLITTQQMNDLIITYDAPFGNYAIHARRRNKVCT